MKKIGIIIIFVLVSCQTNKFKHYILQRNYEGISYSFNNYGYGPNNDSLSSFIAYRSYDSSTRTSNSILFTKKGRIIEICETDSKGKFLGGENIIRFINGRLFTYFTLDSNCHVNGPVFIYNKRGKLDYICVYKQGYYDSQIYSRTGKVYKDTFIFNRFFYNKY